MISLSLYFHYILLLLAVTLDIDVRGDCTIYLPIENLGPQGFVILEQEEAYDGEDEW